MNKPLILTPLAQRDTENAYGWYEKQNRGLGREFGRCIDARLASIRRNPLQYKIVLSGIVRRALVSRFPFSIYYVNEPEKLIVIAILHQHRGPESLRARI